MAKGWKNESRRHSLARRGIKTAQKVPQRMMRMNSNFKKEYNDILENENELTRSDLQGVIDVIARKYNKDSNKLLMQIDKDIKKKRKKFSS